MKTKIGVGLMVAFVLIFTAGCVKKNEQANQQPAEQKSTEKTEEKKAEDGSFFGSLQDLMKKGSSLKCTWEVSEEGAVQKGVMYVSGDKFRQEVTVEGSDALSMNMISDGEWLYQWNPSNKQGTKMKYAEIAKMEEDMKAQGFEEVKEDDSMEGTAEALNQKINYKCEAWKVDNAKFVSPGDVQFTDATKALEDLMKGAENMMQGMCDSCNSLPGTAKDECLKSCQQAQPE